MIAAENKVHTKQKIEHLNSEADASLLEMLTLAVRHHHEGQLSKAENLYREILVIDPYQPNANHNLGVLAVDSDQANLSLDYFRTALDNDPDEPQFWVSYVDALIKAEQHQYAREVLINGLELGLHGDAVNMLVNQLAKKQAILMPPVTAMVNAYANPSVQVVSQQSEMLVAQNTTSQSDWLKAYPMNSEINAAVSLQRSGKLVEAKDRFTKLLKFHPKHPVILTCLGMIYLEVGEILAGKKMLEQSLSVEPNQSTALSNLSIANTKLNLFEEAVKCAEKAVALSPGYSEAHVNCGNALKELNRFGEAVYSYKKAIEIKTDNVDAHFNLGCLLVQLKQYKEAAPVLQKCVELNPKDAEAHQVFADALVELKAFETALKHYDLTIKLNNKNFKAYYGRGFTRLVLKNYEQACVDFERVIRLNPEYNRAYVNLAFALHKLGRIDDAVITNEVLIKRAYDLPHVLNNHGLYLQDLQRLDDALACFDEAALLDPSQKECDWNKAHLQLIRGNFEDGWSLYESRWDTILKEAKRTYRQPLWLGVQEISGKTLFIYPEQGFGDFIQFCRYIPMLEALGAKVILEVPNAMLTLIPTLKGKFTVHHQGSPLPSFDYQCPVMSLPLALKTTLENIPADIPYLYSNGNQVQLWHEKLGEKHQLRVGLVWSGSTEHKKDFHRSIPLEKLKSLLSAPVEFHALQKEIRVDDISTLKDLQIIKTHEDALTDFSATAALIENMDLVISVDTSVAHLAAAIGKICWILLPYAPDFRWMLGRVDSPWYPSVTLFRQSSNKDWDSVINQVKVRLDAMLSELKAN